MTGGGDRTGRGADQPLSEALSEMKLSGVTADTPGDHDDDYEDIDEYVNHSRTIPSWLDERQPFIHDDLITSSSSAEENVRNDCMPLLLGEAQFDLPLNSHGLPQLRRFDHIKFLHSNLAKLPAPYVALDASRPWMFYWSLAGMAMLGENIQDKYKQRLIESLRPLQNKTGGFGSGHGQLSHIASTYASLLALACVDGLDMVDRKSMWHFLGTIKRSNGGFSMAASGEQDVRGAYCAMTAIVLLNLPLELPPHAPARAAGLQTFTDGLGEWLRRCQTYEGGIGGAPTNEAHGAYAFCALACLSLIDAPHISIPKYLDVPALISWLAACQTSPEGGFQGRTNKLVDACYSHWSGSCWSLLHAAIGGSSSSPLDLWNREAQIRYLLCCCQETGKRAGMRDKPSTRSDAYHTCYSLAGLSAAQHHYTYLREGMTVDPTTGRLTAAFNWFAKGATDEEKLAWGYDQGDLVDFVHPVFVIPMRLVGSFRTKFASALL
jgi:protein farnesyltransferase subunit beta